MMMIYIYIYIYMYLYMYIYIYMSVASSSLKMALWYDPSACLAERLGELSGNPCEMVMSLSALTHGLLLAWRLVNKEGAMGGSPRTKCQPS